MKRAIHWALSIGVAALPLVAATASAQPMLEDGFGGPNDYGSRCLHRNDDGSSPAIDITPAFPAGLNFFNQRFVNVVLNTNGNITFGGGVATFTPDPFPIPSTGTRYPMIAPYWADVDIRNGPDGDGGLACTTTSNTADFYSRGCPIRPGNGNGVYWYLETPSSTSPGRAVFTWDRTDYFSCRAELKMSFQMILTAVNTCTDPADGADFDVEFRYTQCEWNTGNASSGTDGFATLVQPVRTCTTNAQCGSGSVCVPPEYDPLLRGGGDAGTPDAGGSDAGSGDAGGNDGGANDAGGNDAGGNDAGASDAGRTDAGASGGTGRCYRGVPAQAGFDARDGTNYVSLPGSRTPDINRVVCEESNVDLPGIWRFQIRNGEVVCPEAGRECDTGLQGVCQEGRTACLANSVVCQQLVEDSDEVCDGLDNDCDGSVDETTPATPICNEGFVCDRGQCIERCFEGGCAQGFECEATTMRCVETGCSGVSCPAGQRCAAPGTCVDACQGIVCPADQTCRAGRCGDLCEGFSCDGCSVCSEGECIPRCTNESCGARDVCNTTTGACEDPTCLGIRCRRGEVCREGECVDACTGAVCPRGEVCSAGDCVPSGDAGVPQQSDAGVGAEPTPGSDAGSSTASDSGTTAFDGSIGNDAGTTVMGRTNCGCRVPGTQGSSGAMSIFGVALALFLSRRRR